jgi:predicted regulator of Ras-like GTPase activity (Roadblock/LC7/MglB family)
VTGEQALADLLDVSEDVVAAVILDGDGRPVAATVGDEAADAAAEIAPAMLAYGDSLRTGTAVTRLQALTAEGSVFLVCEASGTIVAATGRDPVAGLVYHDLRATLRKLRRRTRQKADAAS